MTDQYRLLALIPARGGSRRLPGKNLRPLRGKPLIVWTIDAAKDIPEICQILVSTDDEEIAGVARAAGAYVPWLRPAELASDTASSVDAALHALDWYEANHGTIDGLLLLQPTSPFRTRETIRKGIELYKRGGGHPVLGVSPIGVDPSWAYRVEGGYLVPFAATDACGKDAAQMPQFVVNGAFYLVSPADLRKCRSFSAERTIPLVIDADTEGLDIDTPLDFAVAESLAGRNF